MPPGKVKPKKKPTKLTYKQGFGEEGKNMPKQGQLNRLKRRQRRR